MYEGRKQEISAHSNPEDCLGIAERLMKNESKLEAVIFGCALLFAVVSCVLNIITGLQPAGCGIYSGRSQSGWCFFSDAAFTCK